MLEVATKAELTVVEAAQKLLGNMLLGNMLLSLPACTAVHAGRERAFQNMNTRLADMAEDDSINKSSAPSLDLCRRLLHKSKGEG